MLVVLAKLCQAKQHKGVFSGPPDEARTFVLEAVEVSTRDPQVFKLLIDLEVLHDLASTLSLDDPRGHQALHTANHVINAIVKGDHR